MKTKLQYRIIKTPSRVLNEKVGFLGLGILDIIAIGYFLILTHGMLEKIHLELLAFIFTATLSVVLIGIRQKYRPKIIRDYVSYKFTKRIGTHGGGLL